VLDCNLKTSLLEEKPTTLNLQQLSLLNKKRNMGFCSNILLALFSIAFVVVISEDLGQELTQTKDGSVWCPAPIIGKRCPDSNAFYYYKCCGGELGSDCCFNLQTWAIVVGAIFILAIIASVVGGIVRCLCFGR
jgi:hypothetical protein